ncbi:MAG: hypothetical protein ACPG49_11185 [Chitinophagales bacterium]
MKNYNEYIIKGLLFQIQEVNKMIDLHQEDDFMQDQYKALKMSFMKNLANELMASSLDSPQIFHVLKIIFNQLEENTTDTNDTHLSQNITNQLQEIERMIAA